MSTLETIFQNAICEHQASFGDPVRCGCGQEHERKQPEDPPIFYGEFAGMVIVKGCTCPSASSFGGMAWSHRHAIARFFHGMAEALEADLVRLRGELPADLGRKSTDEP